MTPVLVRRAWPGVGLLACLSALIIPLWLWIGSAHLNHWLGGEDPKAWDAVMRPWAGRLWAGAVVLGLGAWAAYAPRSMPDARRAWTSAGVVGVIGWLVCGVVGIPGWAWLAQIGQIDGTVVITTALLSLIPPMLAVVTAILVAGLGARRLAVLGSWFAGSLALWAVSGSLA